MPVVAVVTLILVGLLVAALAFYLMWVILLLRSVDDTLGKVTFGVRAIAHRTEPLEPRLEALTRDLSEIAGALEELGGKVTGEESAKAS